MITRANNDNASLWNGPKLYVTDGELNSVLSVFILNLMDISLRFVYNSYSSVIKILLHRY